MATIWKRSGPDPLRQPLAPQKRGLALITCGRAPRKTVALIVERKGWLFSRGHFSLLHVCAFGFFIGVGWFAKAWRVNDGDTDGTASIPLVIDSVPSVGEETSDQSASMFFDQPRKHFVPIGELQFHLRYPCNCHAFLSQDGQFVIHRPVAVN